MGKRIIQQARGKGSLTYRTKKKAFRFTVSYPKIEGEAEIVKLFNAACYTAPLAKIRISNQIFYNICAEGIYEGQKIKIGQKNKNEKISNGDILYLKDIPLGLPISNLELTPNSGPKLVRTAGSLAKIVRKKDKKIIVQLPSKKEKSFGYNVRATVGIIAAAGKNEKPILKAGKMSHIKRAKGGRIYPRTSAVKMNAVDHPFGSGRGKRIKGKIPKRNAPPGRKVGLLRPKRTGKRK